MKPLPPPPHPFLSLPVPQALKAHSLLRFFALSFLSYILIPAHLSGLHLNTIWRSIPWYPSHVYILCSTRLLFSSFVTLIPGFKQVTNKPINNKLCTRLKSTCTNTQDCNFDKHHRLSVLFFLADISTYWCSINICWTNSLLKVLRSLCIIFKYNTYSTIMQLFICMFIWVCGCLNSSSLGNAAPWTSCIWQHYSRSQHLCLSWLQSVCQFLGGRNGLFTTTCQVPNTASDTQMFS